MAVTVGAINLVSPNEVGVQLDYDGAGSGTAAAVGTVTGVSLRAALAQAGAAPEAQSALRWWYAQSFLATAAAGRARYFGIAAGIVAPGAITRGAVPYGNLQVMVGANQNPALNCNANGDDVEVTFLGAVACTVYLKLGVKPSQIV